ncbi:hypothetical protein HHK36_019965 [Tetracentron sinense]|uniref:Peroxin-13 n=1 Tax=Tetracentron sinense TaxID=13715 RepID=A0A835DAI7_TETSI|nr:hypothetical protein HHK36_019965 [Tetracentron sinense]
METKPQQGGSNPPPKPWERAGTSSGPAPFKPPSPGSTSDVVEASGTARPGEIVSTADRNTVVNRNVLARPVPTRPWEQNNGSSYGGYGTGLNYNSGYGSYGGQGGSYGGGMYGNTNTMYRGGYGGSYGGSGMYGGGMYNGGFGGSMGGYGMGQMGMGGPYGDQDPNDPFGAPPSPPGFWISFLRVLLKPGLASKQESISEFPGYSRGIRSKATGETLKRVIDIMLKTILYQRQGVVTKGRIVLGMGKGGDKHEMQGVVTVFGRISMLIDQNTQAFHMFMSALLQLFDRSGMLYGELARFALRLLGIRMKPRKVHPPGPDGLPGPHNPHGVQNCIEGPKAAPSGSWDSVWTG